MFLFLSSCQNSNETANVSLEPSGLSGKKLAELHCGGCHSFPKPELLPKKTWENGVLPEMALRLGHGNYMGKMTSYDQDELMAVIKSGTFPDAPLIAEEDWKKIVAYYGINAPDQLNENSLSTTREMDSFSLKSLALPGPGVVATQYLPSQKGVLISSFTNSYGKLSMIDLSSLTSVIKSESPLVKIGFHSTYGEVQLEIGNLDPSEIPMGKLKAGNKTLIEHLHRPSDMLIADINEDGIDDFIIASFGFLTGSLDWFDGKTFEKNTLSNEPGARVIYHLDFDKDGKKDILVLLTQGKESIVLFKNVGKGLFEQETMVQFPPVYGSSYFEIQDFDKDGHFDFVYTNGDNADYSIVKKPYHGVRILINDGKNKFSEKYFYPINGASKVVSDDFDKDGDIDMAVISYFPDKGRNEGFLYFEQVAENKFEVKSKKNVSNRKWLTLDYGDFDNNNTTDFVLGTLNKNQRRNPSEDPVVILFGKGK